MQVLLLTFQTLIRLAKCWLSSKSKLFDILMVLDGTLSLDWHQFRKQIDTTEKIRVHMYLLFLIGGIRLAPVKTEKSQFSIQALLLNGCNLLSVLTDTIIMTNLFSGMEQFV